MTRPQSFVHKFDVLCSSAICLLITVEMNALLARQVCFEIAVHLLTIAIEGLSTWLADAKLTALPAEQGPQILNSLNHTLEQSLPQ